VSNTLVCSPLARSPQNILNPSKQIKDQEAQLDQAKLDEQREIQPKRKSLLEEPNEYDPKMQYDVFHYNIHT